MSKEKKKMNYEFKLSTGKKVIVREPQIRDQDLAAQEAAPRSGDNQTLFSLYVQTAVIKMMIISIDGRTLKGQEKEDLDKVFSFAEYGELQQGMKQILGEVKAPQMSLVADCGDK